MIHEEGADEKTRTTSERDAEQSWRAVMPTVESVLTYSPESAKGHERPVGTLITGEADQQRGRETQCSAT